MMISFVCVSVLKHLVATLLRQESVGIVADCSPQEVGRHHRVTTPKIMSLCHPTPSQTLPILHCKWFVSTQCPPGCLEKLGYSIDM